MSKAAAYNPGSTSAVKDDTFAAFISEQYINEDLKSVPGIGPATAAKLEAAGVETTHQLIAKFISFRGKGISMKDHIGAFFNWLTELKVGAYRNAITKVVAEKVETMMPGTYNEAEFAGGAAGGDDE